MNLLRVPISRLRCSPYPHGATSGRSLRFLRAF